MYNLFKRILPILKNRFFGTGLGNQQSIGKTLYCMDLTIIGQENIELSICNYNKDLFIANEMSWEINDGCSRSS